MFAAFLPQPFDFHSVADVRFYTRQELSLGHERCPPSESAASSDGARTLGSVAVPKLQKKCNRPLSLDASDAS